jgi:carbonic anhydrase/acetyltransferase-like protein (isoleucine patch superfamily)
MALIKTVRNFSPKFGEDCYFAENSTIIGEVICGNQCSFWFNSVIRGDVNFIKMGDKVNVQDGACIHGTYEKHGTTIGNNVSIGHNALVHGCTIHDNVLIGMGAIIMDGVVIEENCIIAAGAVVSPGTYIKSGSVYAGVPAKFLKNVDEKLINGEINRIANNYVLYSSWFK